MHQKGKPVKCEIRTLNVWEKPIMYEVTTYRVTLFQFEVNIWTNHKLNSAKRNNIHQILHWPNPNRSMNIDKDVLRWEMC